MNILKASSKLSEMKKTSKAVKATLRGKKTPKSQAGARREMQSARNGTVKNENTVVQEPTAAYLVNGEQPKSRPVAIDLFCGAGGMSLGMEMAGFDIALAVDYDGYHVATHERNFPYGKVKCASVQDLNGDIIRQLSACTSEIDLVFGGPPCQGFSNMGLRDTHDPRNTLIFHFARLVDELQPKAFIMENVTGLNMGATRALFDGFLEKVSGRYNVTLPVQVLNAVEFGVPQARKRLFVIGIRRDINQAFSYPIPSALIKAPSVIEAIGDLPQVEADDGLFDSDAAPYFKEPASENTFASVARGLSKHSNDFSHRRIWDASLVTGCQRVKHTKAALELYRSTAPGETVPGHKLPRLHPDGICPTLRSGATSERGSHTAPRPIHPFVPRVITVREAARLHGYPDWFSFYPSKMHAYRQIGNSVCPPVAHAVGLEVIRALGINPKSLPKNSLRLNSTFNLPDDRPSQHARIPVKVEYPKIINYLWDKAFNGKTRKLVRPRFGPDDIREAIAATGAYLPRVRPERFLYEAAQQRAIKHILAKPLASGYSVAIIEKDLGIGQFQRSNEPNSLGLSKGIVIKSADLNTASRIIDWNIDVKSLRSILAFIETKGFASNFANNQWKRIEIEKDLFDEPRLDSSRAIVLHRDNTVQQIQILCFQASTVPFDRILRSLNDHGDNMALIIMQLTNHHFAAVLVARTGSYLSETCRTIFSNSLRLTSESGKRA